MRDGIVLTIFLSVLGVGLCLPKAKPDSQSQENQKAFECTELETTIRTPYYYDEGLPDCTDIIAEPINPYRQDFRLECQRWMGTPTVPSIVNNYLIDYCQKFGNGTTKWRATVCCEGVTEEQRCFQCTNVTYNDDYNCAYGNPLVTCPEGQVCRAKTIGYGEYPSIPSETLKSAFCSDVADCPDPLNSFICEDYVPNPNCNQCCEGPFCNLDMADDALDIIYEPCGSNPCLAGGTCISNIADWTYTCECPPGYSGNRCQTDRCDTDCINDYRCNLNPYDCKCSHGYTGIDCTEEYGPCLSDPDFCLNGGTCTDHESYGLKCLCPPTHVGSKCEFEVLKCSDPAVYDQAQTIKTQMTNKNCTSIYISEQTDVKDGNRINSCRNHMKQDGKPKFENNVHGFVDAVEKASIYNCREGEEFGRYGTDSCCPSCYSVPCENNGWCTQKSDGDYVCKCRFGWEGRNCEIRNNVCMIDGDPHYNTFDGAVLHYQGECKYQLAASDESFDPWESFLVVGKNKRGPPPALQTVSYLESIEIFVFGRVVRLDQDRLVYVDEDLVEPELVYDGFRIFYNGPYVRLETNFTLIVEFNGIWTGLIKLPPQYSSKNRGMCGNADGIKENDIMTKEGVDVSEETNRFTLVGESWKLFDENKPNCTSEDTDVIIECPPVIKDIIETDEFCGIINEPAGVFAPCIADPNIQNLIYFDNCVYDVCAYANDTVLMKEAACRSIDAFATICKNLGHVIDWRDEAECPFQCPNGTDYEFSAPACYATCGNPNAPEECPLPNTEGCVCSDFSMVVDINVGCMNATRCGCRDSAGNKWQIGDSWLSEDCTIQYTCEICRSCNRPVGEIISKPIEGCPADEVCVDGPGTGTGQCEISDCPGCKCVDSQGYEWQVGESHISADCEWFVVCRKCEECEVPTAYLDNTYFRCPEGTVCVPNVNTGSCQPGRTKKLHSATWMAWTDWSKCVQTTHEGWVQYRHRKCSQEGKCKGKHFESKSCQKQ